MVKLYDRGVYYRGGRLAAAGEAPGAPPGQASRNTMAYQILAAHDSAREPDRLRLRFDCMSVPDNAYIKLLESAREQGLEAFAIPCVLVSDHNSLCAAGSGFADQQAYALSAAKRFGGIYVPANVAVVHQFMRERMCACGSLMIGADDHARYGALGAMGVGKGGGQQVGLMLGRPYETQRRQVVAVHLSGKPCPGVGPMDVALALLRRVRVGGFVKDKIMEFVGDGIASLDMDFRNDVDVMTAEMGCWSTIWETDETTRAYYRLHGHESDYRELRAVEGAYYDAGIQVRLDKIRPMIALPFSPDHVYEIEELCAHPEEILGEAEAQGARILDNTALRLSLRDKLQDGKLYAQQGIITGCVGGLYGNLCDAAAILKGCKIGDAFPFACFPASQPIFAALAGNGTALGLMRAGASLHPAFCGACAGACAVPESGALSLRHAPRNVYGREGAKAAGGPVASVALMDARSIAATARNGGAITPATDFSCGYGRPEYVFHGEIYDGCVYNGWGNPQPQVGLASF